VGGVLGEGCQCAERCRWRQSGDGAPGLGSGGHGSSRRRWSTPRCGSLEELAERGAAELAGGVSTHSSKAGVAELA
jgi:hypothetical protein